MNKETLIKRFHNKTSSRKKLLFTLYKDKISSFENLEIIAEEINSDLGVENLIKRSDIKYCRYHFVEKKMKTPFNTKPQPNGQLTTKKEMNWTNPDTIEKLSLKSKFAQD